MTRLVNYMGISPLLHFFCYEISSLAKSKALREAIIVNIIFLKSVDEDVAEVLQAKDRSPFRIRAYPVV